jgi:hypothetical protein
VKSRTRFGTAAVGTVLSRLLTAIVFRNNGDARFRSRRPAVRWAGGD